MSIINYDISNIINALDSFDYHKYPSNEIISEIYNKKINKDFLDNLKIIEKYHIENEIIIANLAKKKL